MKEPPRYIETTLGIVTISIASVMTALAVVAVGELTYRTPKPVENHPILFKLYDYEWSALSAVGTVLAALVSAVAAWIAVTQPIRVLRLQREQQREDAADEKKSRLHEATGVAFDAIDIYVAAYEALRDRDPAKLQELAATARGLKGVLKIISRNPALTDGAIFACVNAEVAMQTVADIANRTRNSEWGTSASMMDRMKPLMKEANERAIEVRKRAGIRVRRKGNHSEMPRSIGWMSE